MLGAQSQTSTGEGYNPTPLQNTPPSTSHILPTLGHPTFQTDRPPHNLISFVGAPNLNIT